MKFKSLVELYRTSPAYKNLSFRTKQIQDYGLGYIDCFMEMDVNKITRPKVIDFVEETYDFPGKLRIGLDTLRLILQYGYDKGLVTYNHAKGVKGLPSKKPHARWELDDIEKVKHRAEEHVRIAIDLALYTGQRRSDLVAMRWENYDGTYLTFVQQKTKKEMVLPVHPNLKKVLDKMARAKHGFILSNASGDPLTAEYLGDLVREATRKVGVNKPIHGLRKTTASLLAEFGCSPHEISAITGQSLREVMHYTKQANQKVMAKSAIERWANA